MRTHTQYLASLPETQTAVENTNDETALHAAVRYGREDVVRGVRSERVRSERVKSEKRDRDGLWV